MDDEGSMQVIEAVLVAMLVLSTIVILNALERPTASADTGGVDLGRISSDALTILVDRGFDDGVEEDPVPIEDWLTDIVDGDGAMADQVHDFIEEIIPVGAQYQLRVDNGVDHFRVLPPDLDRTPLKARAATAFVFPDWGSAGGTDMIAAPGGLLRDATDGTPLDWAGCDLTSPTGSPVGPDAVSWSTLWTAAAPDTSVVPASALLGHWTLSGGGCSAAGDLLVTDPAGNELIRPIYSLHLVVWYGA